MEQKSWTKFLPKKTEIEILTVTEEQFLSFQMQVSLGSVGSSAPQQVLVVGLRFQEKSKPNSMHSRNPCEPEER